MLSFLSKYKSSIIIFFIVSGILSILQIKLDKPVILLERFFAGGGWIELLLIGFYASLVLHKMKTPENVPKWRKYTWLLFSIVFFSQLILGIIGYEKFLMTAGKLHLPVPAIILAGPVYRFEIGFMTILFLSTILLSGSAWCSHLCYFGALDNISFKGKPKKGAIKNKLALKVSFTVFVVLGALIMKLSGSSSLTAAIVGGSFGIVGIFVIVLFSRRQGKMVHCTVYCPIGTLVNYLCYINPFRMYIDNNCTECNLCTKFCRYDALDLTDIQNKKPGNTCTLCGDCITSCHTGSIKYKFFNLHPDKARQLYLIITVSLHALFLALARL